MTIAAFAPKAAAPPAATPRPTSSPILIPTSTPTSNLHSFFILLLIFTLCPAPPRCLLQLPLSRHSPTGPHRKASFQPPQSRRLPTQHDRPALDRLVRHLRFRSELRAQLPAPRRGITLENLGRRLVRAEQHRIDGFAARVRSGIGIRTRPSHDPTAAGCELDLVWVRQRRVGRGGRVVGVVGVVVLV